MTGPTALRRNLAVQARLARGTLVLRLGDEWRSLKGIERELWYRSEEFSTREALLAAVAPEKDDELDHLVDDIVEAGFLLTTRPAT